MEILVSPPFTGRLLGWEPRAGERGATLCVKATFALADGREATPAAQQDGVHDDVYWDYNPHASLWAPADLVPRKARVDVLLVGHAYAPAPVESLLVRFAAGGVDKSLRVTGDRVWTKAPDGPRPSAPRPFQRMPLRYERAPRAGDNAVGIPAGVADAGAPLPNVEIAGAASPDATPGFGPIAPRWRARLRGAPDAWIDWADRLRSSAGPPPPGFDFGLFNAAPRDQQIDALPPGAEIVLENLSPTHPRLRSWLPPLRPRAVWIGGAPGPAIEVDLACDTLWIDADRGLAVVSWRGFLPGLADERAPGKLSVVAHAGSPERPRQKPPAFLTGTIEAPPAAAEGAALPFGATPGLAARSAEMPSTAPAPFLALAKQTVAAPDAAPAVAPLPFAPGPSPAAIASPERPRKKPPAFMTGTMEAPPAAAEQRATPFAPFAVPAPAAPPPEPAPLPVPEPAPLPVFEPAPLPASSAAAPPPEPSPIPSPAPAPEAPPPRAPEATPIEEAAAIRASIDLQRTPVAAVLSAHGLSEAEWAAVEQHWHAAMAEEVNRRKGALLRAFDDAYVAQIEAERGPLGAEEIAALLSGAGAAVPGVELPAEGVMRVKRAAIRRVAAAPALAASVRRRMSMAAEQ